jgi:large subunit ribosomal protein L23
MNYRHDIVRRVLITERNAETPDTPDARRTYYFEVARDANKIEIKKAMEGLFDLKGKIHSLRTNIRPSKKKRRPGPYRPGRTPERKRAILTLKPGHEIPDLS